MDGARAGVLQAEWEFFKKACLPQADEQHLHALHSQLENDTWKGFLRNSAAQDEANRYAPLIGCFNEVVVKSVALRNGGMPRVVFKRPLLSENSRASYHPYIVAKLMGMGYDGRLDESWADYERDVVLLGELEKSVGVDENVVNITKHAAQVMSNDSTRRFIFGMTIRGAMMRFWFFTRSHKLVTHDLDMEADAKEIVYFLFALANATEEELGIDPSVRRVWLYNSLRYQHRVGGKPYRIVHAVGVSEARLVLDRGTCTREIAETSYSTGKAVRVGQQAILKYSRMSEEIEECEHVRLTIDSTQLASDTSTKILHGQMIPVAPRAFLLGGKTLDESESWSSSSSAVSPVHWEAPVGAFHQAHIHYRVLSERPGIVLHDINNHKTILEAIVYVFPGGCLRHSKNMALSDLIRPILALEFMYSSGYVHREISAGNLWVSSAQGNVVCKLIDVDYAKRMDVLNHHKGVKTGTPHFIASEVEAGQYLFIPEKKGRLPPGAYRSLPSVTDRESPHAFFCHNCLHDIESLFWIFVYILFSTFPMDRPVNSLDARCIRFQQLFPHPHNDPERFWFLSKDVTRSDYIKELPFEFRKAGEGLAVLASVLADRYSEIEAVPRFYKSNLYFDEDHKLFAEYFRSILPDVYDKSVQSLWPSTLAGEKRKRGTQDPNTALPHGALTGRNPETGSRSGHASGGRKTRAGSDTGLSSGLAVSSVHWEAPVSALHRPQIRCQVLSERPGMALHDISNHKTCSASDNRCDSSVYGITICKFIDLDYDVKDMEIAQCHSDLKRGIPHFIAVEVEQGRYLFRPKGKVLLPSQVFQDTTEIDPAQAAFRHNCLHDMEYLFWIFVYILFSTYPARRPVDNLHRRRQQFDELFPYLSPGSKRYSFLSDTSFRKMLLSQLPAEFKNEGLVVNQLGANLAQRYHDIESVPYFFKSKIDFGDVHDFFGEYFKVMLPVVFTEDVQSLYIGGEEEA
ncbi:hypothetical protein VNI00_008683 [Paramarasmius palmivorus]|uniref:Fungal-type protein kinase domain-containing protein n=1 Tax=Paramarasmius palmivorus TaxID=297713 RepID=A0AAW0CTC0_9AGAR